MSFAFVTGGTGFIGRHLVEALRARGERVRCLVRKTSKSNHLREAGAELIYGDLEQDRLLEEGMYGASTVFHLAGMTAALRPEDMLLVNRDGARRVAKACAKQHTPPKLIHVSSIAAAGPAPRGQIRVEADPPAPISHYGRSKLAGEEEVLKFAAQVPLTIVRPGIVFGPRDKALLPLFQTIKYFNLHAVPGYQSPPLSYIYVADLVELLVRARDRGETVPPPIRKSAVAGGSQSLPAEGGKGYYFAVAPEYPTYADLGRMAAPLVYRPYVLILPCVAPFPWIIAGISQAIAQIKRQPSEVNLDKILEARATSWACSAEAAKRDLAFAPPKSLPERLAETVAWYRQENWL